MQTIVHIGTKDKHAEREFGKKYLPNSSIVISAERRHSQIELPLVHYEFEKETICQRVKDGYINATAMCKAAGREIKHYNALKTTPEFLSALSRSVDIPTDLLIQSIMTGPNELRGTWVHPQVAIHLATWLSPEFAVQVTKWVMDWMSGKIPGGNLPYHLRRYVTNMGNVPPGHFSMLSEMTIALIAPLEHLGYVLPENMVPDISEGRMFCKFLRDNGYDPDHMPQYTHRYEDGREVSARAYPNEVLPLFRRHFVEEWMTKRAMDYFYPRDPAAIPHLEKLLSLPNYREIAGFLGAEA